MNLKKNGFVRILSADIRLFPRNTKHYITITFGPVYHVPIANVSTLNNEIPSLTPYMHTILSINKG